MGKKYDIATRFSTEDHQKVLAALKSLGVEGEKAFNIMEKASKPAKKGLSNVDKASKEAQASMRAMAVQGGVASRVLSGMGKEGLVAAVGLAGVGVGFKASISVIAEFEEQMSGVRAVTSATGGQMAAMESQARSLGETTRFSAAEAAGGMRFLGQAGFEVNEIIAVMPALLNLAVAGQLDLARASDLTSNIMGGFSLAAEEATFVTDIMAVTAASSNTNIEQLGEAMAKVAPVAASFGDNIKDTSALLGVLGNSGLQAEVAGTGLKQSYIKLASPTAALNKVLKELGLTHKDVNPATHAMVDVIKNLTDANIDGAQATEIFGARAVVTFNVLKDHLGDVDALTDKLNNSAGAAKEMAQIMDDNLTGAWKRFKSATAETALQFDDGGLGQATRDAVDSSTEAVGGFNRMLEWFSDSLSIYNILLASHMGDYKKAAEAAAPFIQKTMLATAAIEAEAAALAKVKLEREGGLIGPPKATSAQLKGQADLVAKKEALTRAINEQIKAMEEEVRVAGLSREEKAAHVAVSKAKAVAVKKELLLTKEQIKAIKEAAKSTQREKDAIKELAKLKKDYQKAQTDLNNSIDQQVLGMQQELELLKLTGAERTVAKAIMDAENQARKKNIELTEEQRVSIEGAARELGKEKRAIEDATATAGLFGDAAEDLGDRLVDGLRRGKLEFEDLKDFGLDIFAELARAAIIKTVINPVFSSVGGALFGGQTGQAIQQELGGGGGFNLGGLPNISSLFGSSGTFAGGFGAVNQFGANYLGTGLPGLAGGATGIGLSSIISGGGIGSFGAQALGLGSGNALLDTGAGIAGSFATAALLPVLGPLAPFVGGFAGTALAGLFGGEPSSDIAEFKSTIGEGGAFTNTSYGSKNIGTEKAEEQNAFFESFMQSLTGGFGLDLEGAEIFGGYHSKKGSFFRTDYNAGVDEKEFYYDPNDMDSVNDALFGLAFELAKVEAGTDGVSEETQKLIDAYEALDKAGRDTTEVVTQLAIDTGIAGDNFDKGLSEALKQLKDPKGYALDQLTAEFDTMRETAQELGGDLALVNELEQIRIGQLNGEAQLLTSGLQNVYQTADKLASAFIGISGKLTSALFNLQTGDYSILSTADQLNLAENLFNETLAKADAGDLNALAALPEVGNNFLELSQEFNASSQAFKDDYASVKSALNSAITVADTQADSQIKISQDMLAVLRDIEAGLITDALGASGAVPSNILKTGESGADLIGRINNKSGIDVITDRSLKVSTGWDADGGQTYADWVRSGHWDAGEAYNSMLAVAGGRVNKFASGGIVQGGRAGVDSVPALLTPGEIVLSNRDVEKVIGGNGAVVEAVLAIGDMISSKLQEVLVAQQDTEEHLNVLVGA